MKSVLKVLAGVTALVMTLQAQTPGEAVVEKMIEVYGGEKNLKQLNNYTQQWHIETMTSDTNGSDTREVNLPIFLYTKLLYPHKSETRMLINDYGTKEFSQKKIQATGPMLDAMKLQRMRLYHPLILKNNLNAISVEQTPEHYVLVLKEKALTAKYFVSKRSYLIDKVIGELNMGGQKMEFLTLYEAYQARNGVMLPHKEVKFAGGVNTAVMRLQQMKFTPPPQKHH